MSSDVVVSPQSDSISHLTLLPSPIKFKFHMTPLKEMSLAKEAKLPRIPVDRLLPNQVKIKFFILGRSIKLSYIKLPVKTLGLISVALDSL